VFSYVAKLTISLGARLLLQALAGCFPRISHLFADKAYRGPLLDWIKATLGWETEIVPKAENDARQKWELVDSVPVRVPLPKGGFQVQRHRWKVERTFGWLIRYPRLARDYESLPSGSEALIQIAAIKLFLNRLTPFRPLRT
jgi:transposase